MNRKIITLVVSILFSCALSGDPLGTGFTYQGELKQLGAPANGPFDFRFLLFDIDVGGSSIADPVLLEDVDVADGVFTVELDSRRDTSRFSSCGCGCTPGRSSRAHPAGGSAA